MYEVEVIYNLRIPVRDGLRLSANLFLPVASQGDERFPAILEMIPYRKDDWRYNTDHGRLMYVAAHGFACCRLDVRGTGSSPGVALDEYTAAETQDGYDAVEWLAAQPWCNGNVGMWGVSYGGFTAIQVAMLQPPHLKAIFPVYATDDRYTDDVHYLGGCKTLSEMAQYAVSQVAMNALPPKPAYVEGDWAEQWRARLEATPPWTVEWLRRQCDGPYWRRGSLAPDYERITCAVYSIGGWNDGYTNAALRMHVRCRQAPRKTLVGNWVHAMPDYAYPGPNLDWLHEMLRFFGCWLKGEDDRLLDEPRFTWFQREYTPPAAFPAYQNGCWRAVRDWHSELAEEVAFYLHAGRLDRLPPVDEHVAGIAHQPTWGTRGGLCYGAGMGPNGLARDLRPDEATALTYTSAPLDAPLDLLGIPAVELHVRCTAPVGHLVVRLADVAPDWTSALVSTGVLNLTHRNSHAAPEPLEPDTVYAVRVPLKAIGYRFLPGHCIRLTVATAWWPVVWPAPHPCQHFVYCGPQHPARLLLPLAPPLAQDSPAHLKLDAPVLPEVGGGADVPPRWEIVEDVLNGSVTVHVRDGNETFVPGGVVLYTVEELHMTAHHDDPAHVVLHNHVVYRLSEPSYVVEVVAEGTVRSTATEFIFSLDLQVHLNGSQFFHQGWMQTIPRLLL